MRPQSVLAFILSASLVGACATHRPPAPADGRAPAGDDAAGSIAANIAYAPGRALLCGFSGLSAGLLMIVTLGQSYDDASELLHGGCSGPWLLRPNDIRQAVP